MLRKTKKPNLYISFIFESALNIELKKLLNRDMKFVMVVGYKIIKSMNIAKDKIMRIMIIKNSFLGNLRILIAFIKRLKMKRIPNNARARAAVKTWQNIAHVNARNARMPLGYNCFIFSNHFVVKYKKTKMKKVPAKFCIKSSIILRQYTLKVIKKALSKQGIFDSIPTFSVNMPVK